MDGTLDRAFKALADPTRRGLLDSLRTRNGQTLGELCAGLSMARQSATQHLAVLAEANLISTVRRGREKLHYLNPVPLHEIHRRWIAAFEEPRLSLLSAIAATASGSPTDMTEIPDYVYVTYIEATAERVWEALTSADLTAAYWGHRNVSDWQVGSRWQHVRTDGSGVSDIDGEVLEVTPPHRLVITFGDPSVVTFEIEPYHEIVKLTVTHTKLVTADDRAAISEGWPAVLANLKSLLETGHVMPRAPWEMHAELR